MLAFRTRSGAFIREPSRSVLYHHDDETAISATVLKELPGNRYIIQADPRDPTRPKNPAVLALQDQLDALTKDAGVARIDSQEPFEVDGTALSLLGDWEDGAENDYWDDESGEWRSGDPDDLP